MRVYNKYIKGKNAVYVSFVPKGQIKLALSGAVKAEIEEEEIKLNKLNISEYSPENRIIKKFTPSSFEFFSKAVRRYDSDLHSCQKLEILIKTHST